MTTEKHRTKHKLGRPVTRPEPERIPDSAENVLRAVLATMPQKPDGWKYLKRT